MAVDPKELIKMAPKKRVQLLKQSPQLLQEMMLTGALTPTERALLFPDYFKRTIPEHMRTGTGITPIPADHGTGGRPDRMGTTPDTPATSPRGSYTDAYQKPEKKPTINVASTPAAMGATPDTPVIQVDRSHLEQGGKGLQDIMPSGMHPSLKQFEAAPTTRTLPSLEVEAANERDAAILEHSQKWGIHPSALAGTLDVESNINTKSQGGAGNKYHGAWQLHENQIAGLSQKAGFGRLSPEQYRNLSLKDQLKVKDEYMKQWNIEPGFFTGDAGKDSAKLWALQLAPAKAKKIDYDDPNAVISRSNQANDISQQKGLVTVGSTQLGTVQRGEKQLQNSYELSLQAGVSPKQAQPMEVTPAGTVATKELTQKEKIEVTKADDVIQAAVEGKVNPGSKVVQEAMKMKGLHEVRDRKVLTEYLGGRSPVGSQNAWCAGFVNAALAKTGQKGTGSWAAGSFTTYGDKVDKPENVKAGDIVVNTKKSSRTGMVGSHVMIATGPSYYDEKKKQWMVPTISGNTNDKKSGEGDVVAEYPVNFDTHNIRRAPLTEKYYTKERLTEIQQEVQKQMQASTVPEASPQTQQATVAPAPVVKPVQSTADKSVTPLAPGAQSPTAATPAPQTQTTPQQQTMQQPQQPQYPGNPNDGPRPSVSEPTVDQALLNNRQPQMPKAAAAAYARAQLNSGASPYSKFDSIGGLPSFLA